MKIQMKLVVVTLVCASALSGCMTPGKHMLPPGGAMTMPQIYQVESGMNRAGAAQQSMKYRVADTQRVQTSLPVTHYAAFTATSRNEVSNMFKQIPNPEIPIYIYPHLVRSDHESFPKPGYSSVFFLYRRNQFAMPNERY